MNPWHGVFTALITPFKNGKVDFASLEKLLDQQIRGGVDGFVVNGTTGESPTLSEMEVKELYSFVRQKAHGKMLIVGTGSNSTAKTIEATREAEKMKADAALVVVPYYNKPPQRGLQKHFEETAKSVSLPIFLYNVPGRTITSLSTETISALSQVKNIVGIKEASGKIDFLDDLKKCCPKDFIFLSGDDGTYAEFLAHGGHGVISVASHVIPFEFVQWTANSRGGDFQAGRAGIEKYGRLIDLLFSEANPIPVKKALQWMKIIESAELRLPLCEMDESLAAPMREEMKKCGLLK